MCRGVLLHITEDKEAFMSRTTILNKIQTSERFAAVQAVHEILVKKYGNVTIGGGCLVDSYFDKDFYDVDCFISYKDLKDEWKQEVDNNERQKSHILHVLRDEIDGQDIDIIVVDYSVAKHIRRFDQAFKQIWLDNKGLHIKKQAVKDISNNRISINTVNGPVVYFRVIKSARKYNMTIDDEDFFLLENFMSTLSYFRLSEKYAPMKREFMPYKNSSSYLGKIVFKYSKLYWNTKIVFIPSWRILRKATAWYMQLINWKHIR
jgi:hypothetical protein